MASSDRVRGIIDSILASNRLRESSHFSSSVYGDEPILTTGSQMAGYLPERYRQMRAISRWQAPDGGRAPLGAPGNAQGRWLSEAELFYQQGTFMADWEDDCPYHGTFKSYYPTYNSMSDRQLRGYFTWRAAVRAGRVEAGCLSFAYVYLYELICGIGVADPADGFAKIKAFWRAYRAFAPELDRYAGVWLQDYTVYHGLDAGLLADSEAVARDREVAGIVRASKEAAAALAASSSGTGRRRGAGGIPPLGAAVEQKLAEAVNELSSYRILDGRFAREHPKDVRHVVCAVWLRLADYYRKHRKLSLIESLFGAMVELPYTMFATAVFFDPNRHADADYELDPLNRYRCRHGMWTCERMRGADERSHDLGRVLRAIDRRMREETDYAHPLKSEVKTPKYLEKLINEEIAARISWAASHKPVEVDIDLSALAGIRSAAAETREALLIDEEREDAEPVGGDKAMDVPAVAEESPAKDGGTGSDPAGTADAADMEPPHVSEPVMERPAPASNNPAPDAPGGLSPSQAAYLRALLADDDAAAARAVSEAATSEDLMADAVNETLFDALGDTAIEFGSTGPQIIDDYREDVKGILNHG